MKIPRNSHYPYYYPTQLLLVDDDILFLDNFSLQFNRNLAVRCFASPQHAADYILETQAEYPTIAKQYLDPRIYQRMSPDGCWWFSAIVLAARWPDLARRSAEQVPPARYR